MLDHPALVSGLPHDVLVAGCVLDEPAAPLEHEGFGRDQARNDRLPETPARLDHPHVAAVDGWHVNGTPLTSGRTIRWTTTAIGAAPAKPVRAR